MKLKDPFGYKGEIKIEAQYKIASLTHAFNQDGKGNATEKASPKWDSFKTIETFFFAEYKLTDMSDIINVSMPKLGAGSFGFTADWDVSFGEKGVELTIQGSQPKLWGTNKSDGNINVAATPKLGQSSTGAKNPFVEISVAIAAGDESSGVQVSGITTGASKSSGSSEMVLKLFLDMVQPSVPAPKKEKPNIPQKFAKTMAYFENKNESKLPTGSLKDLDNWAKDIGTIPELQGVIEAGRLEIYLEGNTSKSGTKDYNAKLATQRIDAVERALNKWFGSKVLYKPKPKAQSKVEEKNDYRVDVFFKKDDAEKAIVLNNKYAYE